MSTRRRTPKWALRIVGDVLMRHFGGHFDGLGHQNRRGAYPDEYSKAGAKPPASFVSRLPPKRT